MSRGNFRPRKINKKEMKQALDDLLEYVEYLECGGWQQTLSPDSARRAAEVINYLMKSRTGAGAFHPPAG